MPISKKIKEKFIFRKLQNPCLKCPLQPCTRNCIFAILFEHDKGGINGQNVIRKMTDALYYKPYNKSIGSIYHLLDYRTCKVIAKIMFNSLFDEKSV